MNNKLKMLNSSLALFSTTITNQKLDEIIDSKLFNFDVDSFDIALNKSKDDVIDICLIGSLPESVSQQINIEDLDSAKWQIVYLVINKQKHSTFLEQVSDYNSPDSYIHAFQEFISEKISINSLSKNKEVNELVEKMKEKGFPVDQIMDQKLESTQKHLSTLIPLSYGMTKVDVVQAIMNALERLGVPFRLENDKFFFIGTKGQYKWNMQISVADDDIFTFSLYSEIPIYAEENENQHIYENLNNLNLAIKTGGFMYDSVEQRILFRNSVFAFESENISDYIYNQIDILISENCKYILTILPILGKLKLKFTT
jgi:hypothetical protein